MREKTKEIKIGNIKIGSNNPIAVQSMTNTLTTNADATIKQILNLEDAGCEIIRVSVPDTKSVNSLKKIKSNINIPLVADIHFNHKLAIDSIKYVDKLRINPGNIGDKEKIKSIVQEAKQHSIPIRLGVNIGSLEKDIQQKYGQTAIALVESALRNITLLESFDFYDIVLSLKSSDTLQTVAAYKSIAEKTNHPLHLGITESGTFFSGTIKSSIGLGILLSQGIGDTIRVSLSSAPIEEVKVAWQILKSLNLRQRGINIISCPTCSRTTLDVINTSKKIENSTLNITKPISVAIMGCCVNGPGEAKNTDLGIVGGDKLHLLYKKGKIIDKIKDNEIFDRLMKEINSLK